MKTRTAARLAWLLFGLLFVLAVVGSYFAYQNGRYGDFWVNVTFGLVFLSLGLVGALIVSRRPEHVIGWFFTLLSVIAGFGFAADQYSAYSYLTKREVLPGAPFALWLSNWLWIVLMGSLLVFLPLLFPDGRLPSRRWRPFAWFSLALTTSAAVSFAFTPTLEFGSSGRTVPNPVGIDALEGWGMWLDSWGSSASLPSL